MKTYILKVVVEPDGDRWYAYCPLLEDRGGATWGYTKEEALENIREVVKMTIQSMAEHGEPFLKKLEKEASSEPCVAVTV